MPCSACAGDALGATCEFQSWATIRETYPDGLREIVGGGPFAWPVGHATDDTDLTCAVLLAYLDALPQPGTDVVTAAAAHMLAWLDGHWPDRRPGSSLQNALGSSANSGSTARRALPPPLWWWRVSRV